MAHWIRTSRFVVAALLLFLAWIDLSTTPVEADPGPEGVASTGRPVQVTNRGGPRPMPDSIPGRDTLTVRPQILLASPSPLPPPTSVPTAPPTPEPTSSSEPASRYLGLFMVSGYSDSPRNGTNGLGITKSGYRTRWGVVAVDPRVIPLGSHLMIDGLEGTVFTALDTGGLVTGKRIDVWFPTDWDAIQHGVQHRGVHLVPH